ncbi:CG15657, partial [Drosophila busckii]
ETLISFMMSSFLYTMRFACHPLMVLPMLLCTYYVIYKNWRPRVPGEANITRTPRVQSYRSLGSISSRSNDS